MDQPIKQYYPLGAATLLVIILKKGFSCILFFAILIAAIAALYYIPAAYTAIAVNVVSGYAVFFLAVVVVVFFMGWLQYIRYGIFIFEKSITLKRGLLAVEEIGIPYRRIKDIKIERSVVDQIFGVSTIIITMLESDPGQPQEHDESEFMLANLEKSVAMEIQDMVLKKSQVEDVNILSQQKSA